MVGLRGLVALLYTSALILVHSMSFSEYTIIATGIIAMLIQNVLFGVGTTVWIVYFGTFVGGAAHFVIPILRKLMADRVDEKFYGSLFAYQGTT